MGLIPDSSPLIADERGDMAALATNRSAPLRSTTAIWRVAAFAPEWWLTLGVALALTLATRQTALAHGTTHERIQALTVELAKSPTNAALFFQRGELQLQHGEWLAALRDFDDARRLSPTLPGLDHARARALAGAQQLDEAGAILDRLVTTSPTNATLRLDRARVLGLRGRTTEAVAEFALALPLVAAPDAGHFLEPALLLAKAGQLNDALAWLDRGLKALGPNPELALPAIELLLQQNRFPDALARADAMLARQPRSAPWLALRGDILQQVGRHDEAGRAFRESLAALEALPPTLRRTQANAELERQVRDALDKLQPAEKR